MNYDKPVTLSLAEVQVIAATRALFGFGIGLLVAERLGTRQRRTIGRTLTVLGAISTVPLVIDVLAKQGAFSKQSEDTSSARRLGRQRQWAEQSSGIW